MIMLLEIIRDCFQRFGYVMDPVLRFNHVISSKEKTLEDIEEELGFPRGWTNIADASQEDRVHILRQELKKNLSIDFIFYKYLGTDRLGSCSYADKKSCIYRHSGKTPFGVFIKELLSEPKNYPNVTLKGELKTDLTISTVIKDRCPICGYPMQLKWNKNYGLKLWICTNDQEVCGFMTNDKRGDELSIQKCDWCKGGYLIVKGGLKEPILGCTNYKPDKSGCGRLLSQEHYRAWKKDDFGIEDPSKDKPAYFHAPQSPTKEPQAPEMIPAKTSNTRKGAEVHTIGYLERMIEKDGFKVLVDAEGNLLTDMKLLAKLRMFRQTLAQEEELPAYYILTNDVLARLATDKPTTREEFVEIKGIGERRYDRFGGRFIAEINKHIES